MSIRISRDGQPPAAPAAGRTLPVPPDMKSDKTNPALRELAGGPDNEALLVDRLIAAREARALGRRQLCV